MKTLSSRLPELSQEDQSYIEKFYPMFGMSLCLYNLPHLKEGQILKVVRQKKLKKVALEDINVTEHLFEFIGDWNPHIVYVLGLMWADGHVKKSGGSYNSGFKIISTDWVHVESSLKFFGFWNWTKFIEKAHDDIRKNGKISHCQESTKSCIHNPFFGKFLAENDYLIKSGTSADKILNIIPENLKYYWWRGFFEGDGHLKPDKAPKIQISGRLDQDWKFVEDLLSGMGITGSIYRVKTQKGGHSQFSFGKTNDVIDFCEFIWNGRDEDQIGLKRKYEKYKEKDYKKIFNTSQRKGVCFYRVGNSKKSWHVHYKRKPYGTFLTEEEAIARIEEVEKMYEGTENQIVEKIGTTEIFRSGS